MRSLAVDVIEGVDRGLQAAGEDLTIGTAEGVSLRITDPAVSRFHLELRAASGGIRSITVRPTGRSRVRSGSIAASCHRGPGHAMPSTRRGSPALLS